MKRSNIIIISSILIALSVVLRIVFKDFQSGDYKTFLSVWVESYRNQSVVEAMRSNVSDYPPIYNYFLILFSRLNFNDLYLIKLLSTIFEVMSAIAITMIVSKLTNKKFNWILFSCLLLIPPFIIDSSIWAQCDAIYTFFGLMGIYFAISKKSFKACLFFGLSLAVKFQIILVFPILLVLLLAKNNGEPFIKWKHIFFIPVPFIVFNSLPIFFGKGIWETLGIYARQSGEHSSISYCYNFPWIFKALIDGSSLFNLWVLVFTTIALVWLALVLFFMIKKVRIKQPETSEIIFFAILISLGVLFLMPKMHERFLYMAFVLSVIYMLVNFNKKSAFICITLGVSLTSMFIKFLLWNWVDLYVLRHICSGVAFVTFTCVFAYLMYEFYCKYITTKLSKSQTPESAILSELNSDLEIK